MESSIVTEVDDNDEVVNITLPLQRRHLGDFISSLLGQQQMIERKSEDVFDFDLNWLINLHESINQRITQQSDATLVSFITKITFDDGTSRTIATFDSLKYYAETKNILPIGIHIQWIYLVGFPNRSNPEKQELNFFAISKPRSKEKADI